MIPRRLIAASLAVALSVTALSSCAATTEATDAATSQLSTSELFDSTLVHEITVDFDEDDYAAIIAAYEDDGSKEWLTATVTIDGTVIENVGLRLKGNSSLRGIAGQSGDGAASSEDPSTIPWLIRLDKYVDGQTYQGRSELIVRGNNSETALNEAVALELIGLAGLATQEATSVRFSVNGGDETLRLVIESPDDELWSDAVFGDAGITYEAETEGDYSYRGETAEDYADAFTQQTDEDETNLQPVIDLLAFVDSASDAEFEASLGDYLDVDAFATYLAIESLLDNFDDIDGPGNNSYLRWDSTTGLITVVAWDHNLALGVSGGGGMGGMPGGDGDQQRPPTDMGGGAPPTEGDQGGRPGMIGSNPLSERFMDSATFSALYEEKVTELTSSLYSSGVASDVLASWVSTLTTQASDLVDSETIEAEATSVGKYFE